MSGQQFYDKLLKEDKEFLYAEFNRSISMLKTMSRESSI